MRSSEYLGVRSSEYLTSASLVAILQKAFPSTRTEVRVEGTRYRVDAMCSIQGRDLAIEYDGDSHYRDANVILRDEAKTQILSAMGIEMVRFPYWLQLDRVVSKMKLGVEIDVDTDYPHGFIDRKAVLPASFCELGVKRFKDELLALPGDLQKAVATSLRERCINTLSRFVYPDSLSDTLTALGLLATFS